MKLNRSMSITRKTALLWVASEAQTSELHGHLLGIVSLVRRKPFLKMRCRPLGVSLSFSSRSDSFLSMPPWSKG